MTRRLRLPPARRPACSGLGLRSDESRTQTKPQAKATAAATKHSASSTAMLRRRALRLRTRAGGSDPDSGGETALAQRAFRVGPARGPSRSASADCGRRVAPLCRLGAMQFSPPNAAAWNACSLLAGRAGPRRPVFFLGFWVPPGALGSSRLRNRCWQARGTDHTGCRGSNANYHPSFCMHGKHTPCQPPRSFSLLVALFLPRFPEKRLGMNEPSKLPA